MMASIRRSISYFQRLISATVKVHTVRRDGQYIAIFSAFMLVAVLYAAPHVAAQPSYFTRPEHPREVLQRVRIHINYPYLVYASCISILNSSLTASIHLVY
jgi:hypothetical protein